MPACGRAPSTIATAAREQTRQTDEQKSEQYLTDADISFAGPDTLLGAIRYELKVDQPLDHNKPKGENFSQRVYLTHRGFTQNMVIVTEGYSIGRS